DIGALCSRGPCGGFRFQVKVEAVGMPLSMPLTLILFMNPRVLPASCRQTSRRKALPARCRQHLAGAVRLVRGSWSPNAASKSWGHSPLRAGRGNFSDTRVPSLVPKRLAAAPDGSLSLSERERVRVRVRFGCIDS